MVDLEHPQDDDVDPLIQKIRTLSVTDQVKTGTVALLNIIPCAGGAVASVIGEIATRRKFEKVCDVLSDLNSRLESHGAAPERHLSKDQIIEVVHETLQTVTTASDKQKIAALKNGLAYAFLAEDSFERKQLFLQVLRGCTSIELALLAVVFDGHDPYLVHQNLSSGPINHTDSPTGAVSVVSAVYLQQQQQGYWKPVRNESQCGQPSLLAHLAKSVRCDEAATEGAARLLDGNGLAITGPNLQRSDCKVISWTPTSQGVYVVNPMSFEEGIVARRINATPLEASRTKFGEDFLRFGRGSY